ncbi:MAG: hypothetical protein KY410_00760 [Proteobacteria bacterium]|nr:hypothetical protein [Pseudomonadota bacterium]
MVFELSDASVSYRPPERITDPHGRLAAAEQAIRHFQRSGNPRDLSTASRLIDAFPEPVPPRVTIIDAYVAQARHEFASAQALLEALVEEHPSDLRAWTMLADIHRVRGDLDAAEHACRQRLLISSDPVSVTCLASILGLTGRSDAAADMLHRAASALPAEHPARSWIAGTQAELAVREARHEQAEQLYRIAMQTPEPPLYLVAEYVDLLLRKNAHERALAVLQEYPENSALLVRKAIALQALQDPRWREVDRTLQQLFALEERRDDAIHLRERAAWLLHVRGKPALALQAATRNFDLQKEPEDVHLLLMAAKAAGEPDAAQAAIEFLQRHRPDELPASIAPAPVNASREVAK